MKFKKLIILWNLEFYYFYKTALNFAIEEKNLEIVKLLLSNNKIDVNIINILYNILLFIKFSIYINEIQKKNIYLFDLKILISWNLWQAFQLDFISMLYITFHYLIINHIWNQIIEYNS